MRQPPSLDRAARSQGQNATTHPRLDQGDDEPAAPDDPDEFASEERL